MGHFSFTGQPLIVRRMELRRVEVMPILYWILRTRIALVVNCMNLSMCFSWSRIKPRKAVIISGENRIQNSSLWRKLGEEILSLESRTKHIKR